MGPPTISAEQLEVGSQDSLTNSGFNGAADDLGGTTPCLRWRRHSPLCFNGAADDLGGTTHGSENGNLVVASLQWGRRRSRRNNRTIIVPHSALNAASMGPPTISAEQPFSLRARFWRGLLGENREPLCARYISSHGDVSIIPYAYPKIQMWCGFCENREPPGFSPSIQVRGTFSLHRVR